MGVRMTVGPTPGVLAIEVPYITVGLDELGLPEVEPGLLAVVLHAVKSKNKTSAMTLVRF